MKGAKKAVLVVEDELLLAMELGLSLEDMGHCVIGCVRSGEEALALVDRERPDIVLIDIKLDGVMDGIETAGRILSKLDIPIIFMTGNTDQDTLKRASALNPTGIISKPMNDRDLDMALRSVAV